MKIKTALVTILISLFLVPFVYAQQFGVEVGANITVDLYSQVDVNPATVEISEPSTVGIQILDTEGDGLENRDVEIYINGDDTGISIIQPLATDSFGETSGMVSSSVTGTYEVCVLDVTDVEDIYVEDCESIFVVPVPVPVMSAEPQYTKGETNSISWTHSGGNTYEFQVEVSNTSGFGNILRTTSWDSSLSYFFENLSNNQAYYYHVRAKNEFGGESNWSGYVYSIQDSEDPEITLLEVGEVGENTVEQWDNLYEVIFKFKIEDNVAIDSKVFYCVLLDGSLDECLNSQSSNGDIWTLTVALGDLETDANYDLFEEYIFCVDATDVVGNITRLCDITLTFEHISEEEPEDPVPPPIQETQDIVEEFVNDVIQLIENIVGEIEPKDIELVAITTTITTVFVGITALFSSMGSIPYALFEILLSLLSFLGFRKKIVAKGYVYDSVTKEPIPQAVVRVYDSNGELVWTDVTNKQGYFNSTKLKDGEYRISVTSKDYTFPSKIVFGKEDFPLKNIYRGDMFMIKDNFFANFAIPMDSREIKESRIYMERAFAVLKGVFKFFHLFIFLFGLIFTLYSVLILELWWSYIILLLYIPSTYLLIRSLFGSKEKWGIVKDTEGTLFEGVVVGLRDFEEDRLASKRVTDAKGRYRFVLDKGVYELVILNPDLKLCTVLEKIKIKKVGGKKNIVAIDLEVEDINYKELEEKKEEEILEPLDAL